MKAIILLGLDYILLSLSITPRLSEGGIDRNVRGWKKAVIMPQF